MHRHSALLLCALLAVFPGAANELTAKDQAAARKVYVAKCAKCHRFYEPTNYAETDWRDWMDKMNKKSRLNAEKAELLNRYLDAYRAGRLAAKPEKSPAPARPNAAR